MLLTERNDSFRLTQGKIRLNINWDLGQLIQIFVDLRGFDSLPAISDQQAIGNLNGPMSGHHNSILVAQPSTNAFDQSFSSSGNSQERNTDASRTSMAVNTYGLRESSP